MNKYFALFVFTVLVAVNCRPACTEKLVAEGYECHDSEGCVSVRLTAHDIVTKVYGVFDVSMTRDESVSKMNQILEVIPEEDDTGIWVDSDAGYNIDYYGMRPDCSAVARFDDDGIVKDFGFFFFFPYDEVTREKSVVSQTAFCGSLLQELHDIGADMGVNVLTDAIFETIGQYAGNMVEVRLIDEKAVLHDDHGRFIVVVSVEPQSSFDALLK